MATRERKKIYTKPTPRRIGGLDEYFARQLRQLGVGEDPSRVEDMVREVQDKGGEMTRDGGIAPKGSTRNAEYNKSLRKDEGMSSASRLRRDAGISARSNAQQSGGSTTAPVAPVDKFKEFFSKPGGVASAVAPLVGGMAGTALGLAGLGMQANGAVAPNPAMAPSVIAPDVTTPAAVPLDLMAASRARLQEGADGIRLMRQTYGEIPTVAPSALGGSTISGKYGSGSITAPGAAQQPFMVESGMGRPQAGGEFFQDAANRQQIGNKYADPSMKVGGDIAEIEKRRRAYSLSRQA